MNILTVFFADHLYFLSCLYFLAIWIVIYFIIYKNKEALRQMKVISIVSAVITPIVAIMCLTDWWFPTYIFSKYRFEDILFGFAISGTVSGIYSFIKTKILNTEYFARISNLHRYQVVVVSLFILFGSFYFLHINSFWSSVFCMLFIICTSLNFIPKAFIPSLMTGITILLFALPGYLLASYIHPGWIEEYWLLNGFPANLLFGIPIGEYIYYLLTGISTSLFQEIWFEKSHFK